MEESSCIFCGVAFVPMRGAKGVYCSKECMHEERKATLPHWFNCSKCLASVGIGHTVASRLLNTSKARLHRAWKNQGVEVAVPDCGSWMNYKRAWRGAWWGGRDNATLWMSEYNPKFPDWSTIGQYEIQKAIGRRKYFNLSTEERSAHNKRCTKNRRKQWDRDPSAKKRDKLRMKQWQTKKLKDDPVYRMRCALSTRLSSLVRGIKNGKQGGTMDLIGCSQEYLREHLEARFKRGMTWLNYGTHWHVDHVLPCASFNHSIPAQVRTCWHFSNLAPLEASKNISKGCKITKPQMCLTL